MIGLVLSNLFYCVTDLPAAYLETYEFLAIGKVSFHIYKSGCQPESDFSWGVIYLYIDDM